MNHTYKRITSFFILTSLFIASTSHSDGIDFAKLKDIDFLGRKDAQGKNEYCTYTDHTTNLTFEYYKYGVIYSFMNQLVSNAISINDSYGHMRNHFDNQKSSFIVKMTKQYNNQIDTFFDTDLTAGVANDPELIEAVRVRVLQILKAEFKL